MLAIAGDSPEGSRRAPCSVMTAKSSSDRLILGLKSCTRVNMPSYAYACARVLFCMQMFGKNGKGTRVVRG